MALTPWNRQEEWYQQMINASTGNYLPSISAQDAGKVMTVESDGSWGVENVPTELPSVTSADETKVLTVDSNGDWVAADAPSGLPSTTSASAGDVLSLNNSKEAVWATPSSGGGVLVVTDTNGTLDKTWQEIHDAFLIGAVRITNSEASEESVYSVNRLYSDVESNTFTIERVINGLRGVVISIYVTNSADGYPVLE